ncbi:MAG: DUF4258 domain-containing protein [Oscillospiraceae bacterium]|nr:DUF4258 domain-containing protein [Oscillospiraceae bacterium]
MIDIENLRALQASGAVKWSEHIALRMLRRGISKAQVVAAIKSGAVIEDYPDAYPYPACLILGKDAEGTPLHVCCGIGAGNVWMITAYRPDADEWEDDLRTRKVKQ